MKKMRGQVVLRIHVYYTFFLKSNNHYILRK